MRRLKSLFLFSKQQQRGIFVLVLLLLVLLGYRWYAISARSQTSPVKFTVDEQYQQKIDSLRKSRQRKDTIYPFNPNYLTDYRAYTLGLTNEQIDRLMAFRKAGQFVNSVRQFQQVTQVDQVWVDSMQSYFKFPVWVTHPTRKKNKANTYNKRPKATPVDINAASAEQLQGVYGIGPAISGRIIKEREKLNGFIAMQQIRSVYGMSDSTFTRLQKRFFLQQPAGFKQLDINTASKDQLLSVPYINDYLAEQLIEQRTLREGFSSWDEVVLTSRFPEEKLALFQLYLKIE